MNSNPDSITVDQQQTFASKITHKFFSERDIVSLSGGETFQLSVGLALGIGELQYNYEPIESLFIDEGFGSLDEDSLHLVTHTLSKLSQRLNK